MCTVKDLKIFLASKGMTVGETRSLIYKMLDNLDSYRDEEKLLLGNMIQNVIENRNNYKGVYTLTNKKKVNNAISSRYN